ncbi:sulfurtransferase TusA family protein [Roseibium alexandrii]|uniref:sulfurtransferase TusA family protein n=1 Tax=Roseibium alexandrii TaxID=388408 RepID=UPI00375186E5
MQGKQDAVNGVARVTENTLDLMGLKCPLPVLKTKKALSRLNAGVELRVQTTDPMAEIDIPHFCQEQGHTLVNKEKTETGHSFVIRKG